MSAPAALSNEVRNRLGPCPKLRDPPLVSIVVLNRDGLEHLRRLLAGLVDHTDYPHLELILVDNGSSDGSLDFARRVEAPFPISIVANHHNESFSDANNQGAGLARGELLLLLNNDIEPFERGWLRELVACQLESGAGIVGATSINPPESGAADPAAYNVQTRRVRMREGARGLEIAGHDPRTLLDESLGRDVEVPFAVGPCFLIPRNLFGEIGGFTSGYFYGGEDIDLCFKVRERGSSVRYSGRSVLIHHRRSTTRRLTAAGNGFSPQGNNRLLGERWGPRMRREVELDRLAGGGFWAAEAEPPATPSPSSEAMALSFCIKAEGLPATAEPSLRALDAELRAPQPSPPSTAGGLPGRLAQLSL